MGGVTATRASVAVLLAIVVGACSSTSKPPATAVAPTVTTSPSRTGPTEEARAYDIALTDADFPSGWSGEPHADDPTEKDFERRLKACSGVTVNVGTTTDVFGDDFSMDTAGVGSEVEFFKTAAAVRADIALANNSRFISCVRNILVEQLKAELAKEGAQGATIRSVTLTRVAIRRYAEGSVALRLTATVSAGGQTLRFYQDVVAIRKGRLEVSVSFFSLGQPFQAALERALLAKISARMVKDGGA